MHLERAYCVWSILWLYTAPICRGWPMLENDFDMQVTSYSDDVIQAQRTHDGIMHQSLMISI